MKPCKNKSIVAQTVGYDLPAARSYGGVLLSACGRFLLRKPDDTAQGYAWTWPKGRPEAGETPAQTALREVHEETGYRAAIIAALPGVYTGTMSSSAFFLMRPLGEPDAPLNETAATIWASYRKARRLVMLNEHPTGRERDCAILEDAMRAAASRNLLASDARAARTAVPLPISLRQC
jgi:8-oxo-dGTP diphosphatase